MKMAMGTFKDSEGHYYHEKKKKRDRPTGHVATPGTPVTLQGQYYTTGPFIAETIWVCNGDTAVVTAQIFDGATPLTCPFSIAAGVLVNISPVWMPFFTAVNFDASSTTVTCTMGGWIP